MSDIWCLHPNVCPWKNYCARNLANHPTEPDIRVYEYFPVKAHCRGFLSMEFTQVKKKRRWVRRIDKV